VKIVKRSRYSRWTNESNYVNWIKRFKLFDKKRHQAETSTTDIGRRHKIADVYAKIIIGVAGLVFALVLGIQQQQLSKELSNQQQQFTKQIEDGRKGVSESQVNVMKNQFAASLINPLIRGSEKEKLLALAALKKVDEDQWITFSGILAQHDSKETTRIEVIRQMGETGDSKVRPAIRTIQESAKTQAEREQAKQAQANLAGKFNDNLKTARAFYEAGQWEIAAKYFYEASKYVNETQVEGRNLAAAKSHYEHGGYREAADAFKNLFSKF
jgi:hypothetical protein